MKPWVMSESSSLLNKLQYVGTLLYSFHQSDDLDAFINSIHQHLQFSGLPIYSIIHTQ